MIIIPDYLLFLNNDIIPYFPQYFPPKENARFLWRVLYAIICSRTSTIARILWVAYYYSNLYAYVNHCYITYRVLS